MADGQIGSGALIAITHEVAPKAGGARLASTALIAIVGEKPPTAGGAIVSSAVLIAIDVEYVTPIQYNPISIRPVFAFPLMIGGDY